MIEIGPNLLSALSGVGGIIAGAMFLFWMYKMVELSGK